ncbi:ADP/ATP carrier protein [Dinochytrium kinnereticum]|nr:ADP/ATP carrier protein [Dinochytrium kinnereticum]
MAKVRLQWRPPKPDVLQEQTLRKDVKRFEIQDEDLHEMVRYRGTLDVLRKVARTEGVLGWYAGMPAQLLKAVLCQGLLFVSKDKFQRWTLLLFTLFARRSSSNKA